MKLHKSQEMRMKRIEEVHNFISEKPRAVNINQIMANFPQISRQTLQDYVRLLETSKKIKRIEFGKFVSTPT